MLDRRRRRRANIETTLVQCLVFAGYTANTDRLPNVVLMVRQRGMIVLCCKV